MTKTLDKKTKFSLLHTNISLTGNGGKLEYTLTNLNVKFGIIAVTGTWEFEKNEHVSKMTRVTSLLAMRPRKLLGNNTMSGF